ncbi:MAG: TonB-dependent receptor [Burkholderiales bacterium]|nr:TonB-dependent receptor [Burkholderiales bacterium]
MKKQNCGTLVCIGALVGLGTGSIGQALAQDVPVVGGAEPATRQPGGKLERVEVMGKQATDNDLRRRAQVAKQVYGREELDKYGDNNVADVLKRLPGITMQGNAPRMRGLGSGYTLILINGDPAPPGFALDQLDPAQVERIEVTKGPTANQSAQAVAGAINIVLKDAPKVSQRDLRAMLGYSVDKPTVSGSFTIGEKWNGFSLSLPISLFQWRNRNDSVVSRSAPGIDGQLAQSLQQGENLSYGHGINIGPRLNWKISDDETLTWQSFVQKGTWINEASYRSQILAGIPSLEDNGDFKGGWQNVRSNLQWVNHLSTSERIELKAGVSSSKGSFDGQTVRQALPFRRTIGDNADLSATQSGNYNRLLNDQHSLTVGWDLEWRQRDEKRDITENGLPLVAEFEGQPFSARIQRQAFFVQDEWEINKQWSTYLGLRAEQIASKSQGLANPISNTSNVVTPMVHLNYKFDAAGRDLVRASVTRSYKAPDLSALMARPFINNLFSDTSKTNTELSPDRMGNPTLLPELATGLDVALEKYLPAGGLISIGVFYRQVDDLIRNVTGLQNVDWSGVPRWVSRPVNFSKAMTRGLELEVKGRAGELLPGMVDAKLPLNLRGSVNVYQSSVDALPGPNNRLDGQQPWSGNFGFDYRVAGLPMTMGGSLAFTPGYTTQQSQSQFLDQSRARSMDFFAQWMFSPKISARFAVNNLVPLDGESRTFTSDGYSTNTLRTGRTQYSLGMEIKL